MRIIVPRGLEKSQDFSGFLKKGVQEMNAQELKHKARLAEWKESKRQMRNRQTFYVVWRFGLDLRIIELQVENKE